MLSDLVRQRSQLTLILLAWFIATGAQWDVLQTFGWVRMVITYSETMPLLKAIQRTFDGEMCGVCEMVKEAKQQESAPSVPSGKVAGKMIFVSEPAHPFIVPVTEEAAWSHCDALPLSAGRSAPPTPPPRV